MTVTDFIFHKINAVPGLVESEFSQIAIAFQIRDRCAILVVKPKDTKGIGNTQQNH